ncbi:hypothetical protein CVT24_004112 [Panaeolus cyanescens]|uniref:RING-type domain-containing protein n=1 Tax=Panaeolus cyanescens TaxID=181874 RepID=A0A409Y656_9AGAR|nr:hypothetical protein CVT24_004112 [Panaeolus cyanescens]
MPATRTSQSSVSRSTPFSTNSPPSHRTSKEDRVADQDVLSLTLDRAESSKGTSSQSHKPNSKSKAKIRPHKSNSSTVPLPQVQEIIEISSDDDDTPPHPSSHASIIANLRRELEAVRSKRHADIAMKQLKALQEDNAKLKSVKDDTKIVLDAAEVSEHFECAICASEMWTPYTLPNCGHTFCQKCLLDWFDTTQAKFLAAHPAYHAGRPHQIHALSQILDYLCAYPNLAADPRSISALKQTLPIEPKYECPECRSQVTSAPIEAFAMKKLIRTVAAASGRGSPKPKSKHPIARNSPWDGYFPKSKLS